MNRAFFVTTIACIGILTALPTHAAEALAPKKTTCEDALRVLRQDNRFINVKGFDDVDGYNQLWSLNLLHLIANVNQLPFQNNADREAWRNIAFVGDQYKNINHLAGGIRNALAKQFPNSKFEVEAATAEMGSRYIHSDTTLIDGIRKVKAIRLSDIKPDLGEIKIVIATDWTMFGGLSKIFIVKSNNGPNFTLVDLNNPNVDVEAKFEDLYGINDAIVPKFTLQSGFGVAPVSVLTVKTVNR